jgi:hypothetical protein
VGGPRHLPSAFFLIFIAIVTSHVIRFAPLLRRRGRRVTLIISDWADPTYKTVRVIIFAFALVVAFPYLPGSSSPAFTGVSVFVGVLVSLASSSSLSNIMAGLVLTYSGGFKVGDYVRIGETLGTVESAGSWPRGCAKKLMSCRASCWAGRSSATDAGRPADHRHQRHDRLRRALASDSNASCGGGATTDVRKDPRLGADGAQ